MIDWTKPIQTLFGEPARVLCTDLKTVHKNKCVIAYCEYGYEKIITVDENGFWDTADEHDRPVVQNVPQRHKHADVIIAWANGARIQHRHFLSSGWSETARPIWSEEYEYRVKPE